MARGNSPDGIEYNYIQKGDYNKGTKYFNTGDKATVPDGAYAFTETGAVWLITYNGAQWHGVAEAAKEAGYNVAIKHDEYVLYAKVWVFFWKD